jgi:uncharacterized protein (DUF433 family)
MPGKPAVRGARITVEHILESLAGGRSWEEILDGHPPLTEQDISAAPM